MDTFAAAVEATGGVEDLAEGGEQQRRKEIPGTAPTVDAQEVEHVDQVLADQEQPVRDITVLNMALGVRAAQAHTMSEARGLHPASLAVLCHTPTVKVEVTMGTGHQ